MKKGVLIVKSVYQVPRSKTSKQKRHRLNKIGSSKKLDEAVIDLLPLHAQKIQPAKDESPC